MASKETMDITIASKDILRLRSLVAQLHEQISNYPVVQADLESFKGTKDWCLDDMACLRKMHRRLTLAARKVHGHDCHPEALTPPPAE